MSIFTTETLQGTQKVYSKPSLAIPKEIEVTFMEMRFEDDEEEDEANPGRYDSPGKSRNTGTGSPPKKKNRKSMRKQSSDSVYMDFFPNGACQDSILLGRSGGQILGRSNKRWIHRCRYH
jgi:hypothetical protein